MGSFRRKRREVAGQLRRRLVTPAAILLQGLERDGLDIPA